MIQFFSDLYWKMNGWKIVGEFPSDLKKMMIAIAPHTSWLDILIGFAGRKKLKIEHAKFLAKKELFDGFFGKWLVKLGGIPVDRKAKLGTVDQVVKYYNDNEEFILGMSPEGTRKRIDRLKTGFYYMAKNANVPILLLGFDFKNKEVVIAKPFYATDNEEADFKKIIAFFSTIEGYNPELDMRHLKVE